MRWHLALILCFAMGTASADNRPLPEPQSADVRLLVDISGSMRRTDPDNLRRPALSLFVRLMPADGVAGVWTFGQQVNPLISHAPADAPWKEHALSQVDAIDSVALYTNIGRALEQAAFDLSERLEASEALAPVDIILLTDGMVDISPDEAVNRREQSRVMEALLPQLGAAGYRVHTLGLSDEADESLLRELARTSDGIFTQARNADDLMDGLLEIFQQTVPSQRVPIEDGQFLVDDHIDEFTVLVRRGPDQPSARLLDPEGRRYQRADRREGLNWHHTDDYDLITQTDPVTGVWALDADLQPYSRLTVLSDLQLKVQPLPNNWVVGQALELEFAVRDGEGVIDDPEILSLLDFDAQFVGARDEDFRAQRWYREPPEDGIYRMSLPVPRTPGQYGLELRLDGNTFKRLFSHQLAVASQFTVQMEKQVDGHDAHWEIVVNAVGALIPEATDVVAHTRSSAGLSRMETMESETPGVWRLRLMPQERANYRVGLRARGELRSGAAFEEELPTQYFRYPEDDDLQVLALDGMIDEMRDTVAERREAAERARRGEESTPVAQTLPDSPEQEAPAPRSPPRETGTDIPPVWLYASLVLVNGALLFLAYWGYRRIMGLSGSAKAEEDDTAADAPGEQEAPPPMQQIAADVKPLKKAGPSEKAEGSEEELGASASNEAPAQDKPAKDQSFSDETPADEPAQEKTFSDQPESDGDEEPLFPLDDGSDKDDK